MDSTSPQSSQADYGATNDEPMLERPPTPPLKADGTAQRETDLNMTSPYSALFNTNYVPTEDEMSQIRAFREDINRQQEQLDEKIEAIQAQLDALLLKKKQIADFAEEHTRLLSPIRRFPPDLLGEVFYRCLPPKIPSGIKDDINNACPTLLTRVCSSWRQVALTTPRLWTSVSVHIPSDCEYDFNLHEVSTQVFQFRARRIREWLGRAKGLLLDVSVTDCAYCGINVSFQPLVDEIFSVLLPSVPRWRTLTCSQTWPKMLPIQYLPASSFASLTSLSIYNSPEIFTNGNPGDPANNSVVAPPLKTIAIGLQSKAEILLKYRFQWSQLQHLSINCYYYHDPHEYSQALLHICTVLKLCNHLKTLRFHLDSVADEWVSPILPYSGGIITLPHLTTLSLVEGQIGGILLRALDAPALGDLRYDFAGKGIIKNAPRIHTFSICYFLQNQKTNLHTLTVDPNLPQLSDWISCLEFCPTLKRLHFKPAGWRLKPCFHDTKWQFDNEITSEFLFELAGMPVKSDDDEPLPNLCPKLEEFTCAYILDVTEDEIITFLKCKQSGENGISPLRRLTLCISDNSEWDPMLGGEIESFGVVNEVLIEIYRVPYYPSTTYSTLNPMLSRDNQDQKWFVDYS